MKKISEDVKDALKQAEETVAYNIKHHLSLSHLTDAQKEEMSRLFSYTDNIFDIIHRLEDEEFNYLDPNRSILINILALAVKAIIAPQFAYALNDNLKEFVRDYESEGTNGLRGMIEKLARTFGHEVRASEAKDEASPEVINGKGLDILREIEEAEKKAEHNNYEIGE
jgi:hypothetical protein